MKINRFNPATHKGTQPIRVLQYNVIQWFENSDSIKEMKEVINKQGLQGGISYCINENPIINSQDDFNHQIPYIDINKKIVIHETFLSYLWTLCYSVFVLFDEAIKRPLLEGSYKRVLTNQSKLARKAFLLFKYGISLIRIYSKWDKINLPNPEEYNEHEAYYIEKANSVFLFATTFILLHELAHVKCGHIDFHREASKKNISIPNNKIKKEEYEADELATKSILKKITGNREKINIGIGLLAGLCSLLFFGSVLTSSNHPDSDERIRLLLEKLNLEDEDNMWGVACLAFKLWDNSYNINLNWPKKVDTYKELFYSILKQLEKYK